MANPYSGYGISDRDYAATVAALAGEMSPKAKQDDVDRILDSIVNRAEQKSTRLADGTVAPASLGSVVTASGQYDAMRGIGNRDKGNARTNGGQRAAREAFIGALAPSKLSPDARTRVEMANTAIENVIVSGVSRGIAKGATDYRNVEVTDAWGTGAMHRANERNFGFLDDATGHRFSGPGFNSEMEFDPVSLHGQLQDVGLPAELSGLTPPAVSIGTPDLPGPLGGFGNIDGLSIGAPSTPDVMSQFAGPSYSNITNGTAFDPIGGLNVSVPSTPDVMGQFDGPTYPDMSAGLYDGAAPASDVSVPSPPDVGGLYGLDAYGPAMSEAGWASPSHTGMDAGSFQTPDFNAPSLAEQRAFQGVSDPITSYSYDSFAHGVNADLMGELSPSSMRNTNTPSFDTVSVPEHYTSLETRTREVPFSAPNALQDAVMGDWEDKLGPAKPAMASKPQTRIETYQVPVEKTRMVQQQVPKALPSMPPAREVPAAPALSSSFASAPPGLGDQFGMGLHGFEGFLGAMNARDPAAMNAINNAGMGYAANYAMGDGPYATMGTNDLQDRFGSQFGMDARKSIAEGFKQDYGQLSPTARGGIEGAMKGLAMGGPLGALAGGAWGAFSGYAMPNGIMGTLGSMFDGTFGGGFESGTPGNMSNYGSPYDGAGLAGPYDSLFSGAPGAAGNMHDMQAIQDAYDARNSGGGMFGGGGGWGHDPSEDGGARYS